MVYIVDDKEPDTSNNTKYVDYHINNDTITIGAQVVRKQAEPGCTKCRDGMKYPQIDGMFYREFSHPIQGLRPHAPKNSNKKVIKMITLLK